MALIQSAADPAELDLYRSGECHVFAVALNRMFGWPIRLVLDQGERYWEDPKDADNWIPAVVHAYAIDNDELAWDIAGSRPLSEIPSDLENWTHVREIDWDLCSSESSLKVYVGYWKGELDDEEIDRPLDDYSQADVDEATTVALRVLDGLPGFPVSSVASPV